MPSQGTEYALLIRKTGDTETTFPSEDADLLFDEAESDYADYSRKVIFNAVVVARLTELWTASTKQVTYQLNETRFNLSDIAKALKDRLDSAQAKLDDLLALEKPLAVGMGTIRKVPTKWREVP